MSLLLIFKVFYGRRSEIFALLKKLADIKNVFVDYYHVIELQIMPSALLEMVIIKWKMGRRRRGKR